MFRNNPVAAGAGTEKNAQFLKRSAVALPQNRHGEHRAIIRAFKRAVAREQVFNRIGRQLVQENNKPD